MSRILVDFSHTTGTVKPMHSVNNGPVTFRGLGTDVLFREAGIPYARTHDASFCESYGKDHTVDVHMIFRDFDADENDPASYDFAVTDKYLSDIQAVGTKVFYRLGSKIEHEIKKYGTIPPKDFAKFARVCEHIIRHYTEGWADGFCWDIEYWEIWNEPDCYDGEGKPLCWQGTLEEFTDFCLIVFKHLKKCFPHLKIGAPATVQPASDLWPLLLPRLKAEGLTLDFYSFHRYAQDPRELVEATEIVENTLTKYGIERTELILDEWNYICGWSGELFRRSKETIISQKGASFVLGGMLACQKTTLDHLMYYDARPSNYSGFFDLTFLNALPPYTAFYTFGTLYRLKNELESASDDPTVYVGAAGNEEKKALVFTYYEQGGPKEKEITLTLTGTKGLKADIYRQSKGEMLTRLRTEFFDEDETTLTFSANKYDIYYLELTKEETL